MTNEMRQAARPPGGRSKRGAARLAALVPAEIAPVFRKRGFASADLAVHWPEIAGPGAARFSRPLALSWPRGGAESGAGATLTIACTGAFALDLQQMGPVIIERINQRLGWRCVARMTIRQQPVRPATLQKRKPELAPEDVNKAGRIAAGIGNEALKQALVRLGAATLARARKPLAGARKPP